MKFLLLFISVIVGCGAQDLAASCAMEPNINDDALVDQVYGTVTFFQAAGSEDVAVGISLTGFNTSDGEPLHGFHIHESGDLTGGCESAGGHFNPDGYNHGAPEDSERHVGDLGNIEEGADGSIEVQMVDDYISLRSNSTANIMGRAVVIHQSEDDLGESGDPAGAAGARIACCVIGFAYP